MENMAKDLKNAIQTQTQKVYNFIDNYEVRNEKLLSDIKMALAI